MFIHNRLKLLLKNTVNFKSQKELNDCMILATDKNHYLSSLCNKYLEYYERSLRLTIIENKYHELLADMSYERDRSVIIKNTRKY